MKKIVNDQIVVASVIGLFATILTSIAFILIQNESSLYSAFLFFFFGGLVLGQIFPKASWTASLFISCFPFLVFIGFFIYCLRGCGEGGMLLVILPFILTTLAGISGIGFIVGKYAKQKYN